MSEFAVVPRERSATNNFLLPQVMLMICVAARLTPVTVLLLATIPLMVDRRWLLTNWLAISLINFAQYSSGAPWIGLLPTYYFAFVAVRRFGIQLQPTLRSSLLEVACVVVILANLVFLSWGQYFWATALKSSIQLIFLLLLAPVLRSIPADLYVEFRRQLVVDFPKFFVGYLVVALLLWQTASPDTGLVDEHDAHRFGGMVGPQASAFAFTALFAFFWLEKEKRIAYVCLLAIAITGSRTYAGIAALVIFVPVFTRKMTLSTRILGFLGFASIVVAFSALLPLLSSRFVMDERFYGTLWGRLVNYQYALDYIRQSPIIGNGMGSMLLVLENWVPEFFDYYRVSGDTTIMHNEYLRILMETGATGGVLAALCLKRVLTVRSAGVRTLILIFLAGSLTENTLANFSTAMLTLMLLVGSSVVLASRKSTGGTLEGRTASAS
jgi:O-antigen ligase